MTGIEAIAQFFLHFCIIFDKWCKKGKRFTTAYEF